MGALPRRACQAAGAPPCESENAFWLPCVLHSSMSQLSSGVGLQGRHADSGQLSLSVRVKQLGTHQPLLELHRGSICVCVTGSARLAVKMKASRRQAAEALWPAVERACYACGPLSARALANKSCMHLWIEKESCEWFWPAY